MTKKPGDIDHRTDERLEVPRWQVDDQPPMLAALARQELCHDHFDVPVRLVGRPRIDLLEAAVQEGIQIHPQQVIKIGHVELIPKAEEFDSRGIPTNRKF